MTRAAGRECVRVSGSLSRGTETGSQHEAGPAGTVTVMVTDWHGGGRDCSGCRLGLAASESP